MKVEITTTKEFKEIIEVEFPYYYKHELLSDYSDDTIYGKMLLEDEISIKETEEYCGSFSYEIEKKIRNSKGNCYFTDKYKSNEEEFESARFRALEFLREL